MNLSKNKKVLLKCFFISNLISAAVGFCLTGIFISGNKIESLLFYAKVPLSDGSSQAVENCIRFCLPAVLAILIIINVLSWKLLSNIEKIKSHSEKSRFCFPLKQLRFIYRYGYLLSLGIIFVTIIFTGFKIDAWAYFAGKMRNSTLYEEYYNPPEKCKFEFPEKKKNLVYIFLESMETSFASTTDGGLMQQNLIPHLTNLAKENISFSDTEKLGGAQSVSATSWTVASMVSQTSGTPLAIPLTFPGFGKGGSFLPGVYSIGEVLGSNGYNQTLMMGSKSTFAKRKDYFKEHGNYNIFDYYTATGKEKWHYDIKNLLPEDYYVWWGFEDYKLFEYAKDEIEYLAKDDNPFNLTMITVDTHFYDGYKCLKCENKFNSQYENVINCSDRLVYEFTSWILNHPNKEISENTVIVLSGDHPTMDHDFVNSKTQKNSKYSRKTYNCFINTGLSDKNTKNRIFTLMDMYPTTLAALGVNWGSEFLGLGVNLFSGKQTICEKIGYSCFTYELSSNSDFYKKYIMN